MQIAPEIDWSGTKCFVDISRAWPLSSWRRKYVNCGIGGVIEILNWEILVCDYLYSTSKWMQYKTKKIHIEQKEIPIVFAWVDAHFWKKRAKHPFFTSGRSLLRALVQNFAALSHWPCTLICVFACKNGFRSSGILHTGTLISPLIIALWQKNEWQTSDTTLEDFQNRFFSVSFGVFILFFFAKKKHQKKRSWPQKIFFTVFFFWFPWKLQIWRRQ